MSKSRIAYSIFNTSKGNTFFNADVREDNIKDSINLKTIKLWSTEYAYLLLFYNYLNSSKGIMDFCRNDTLQKAKDNVIRKLKELHGVENIEDANLYSKYENKNFNINTVMEYENGVNNILNKLFTRSSIVVPDFVNAKWQSELKRFSLQCKLEFSAGNHQVETLQMHSRITVYKDEKAVAQYLEYSKTDLYSIEGVRDSDKPSYGHNYPDVFAWAQTMIKVFGL